MKNFQLYGNILAFQRCVNAKTLVQVKTQINNLKNLFLLIIILLFSNLVIAQPGWQDFTARYSYTITDKNGKEISFKNNKNYRIMVDSVLYKASNIPQDSLKHPLQNSYGFENQIRINDFSLAVPQKNYRKSHRPLEIKIIHKKDTMFICQSTGTGSSVIEKLRGKPIKSKSDFTLQFIKGYYFFPNWAKNLLDNLPQTNGSMKIANIDQRHFIIPKTIYDSVFNIRERYDNRQQYYDEAEKLVV